MRWYGLKNGVIVCALMAILLSACARVSGGTFCRLYEPVYTVPADSAETQQQVDANNVVWLMECL